MKKLLLSFIIFSFNTLAAQHYLDSTFGVNGIAIDTGRKMGSKIHAWPNGKIAVVSLYKEFINVDSLEICLVQLNENGTLDINYGNNGLVKTGAKVRSSFWRGYDRYPWALFQENDKVIIFYLENYLLGKGSIRRFNSTGSADSTFGINGRVSINLNVPVYSYGLSLQPDGKILFTAGSSSNPFLIRYNIDGSQDPTFGVNGIASSPASIWPYEALVQSDGKIVIAGGSRLMRLTSTGKIDSTYGINGLVQNTAIVDGYLDPCFAIDTVNGVDAVLTGGFNSTSLSPCSIHRFNKNGKFDSSFHQNGKLDISTYDLGAVLSLLVQHDGKILAAGDVGYGGNFLMSINSNGTVDSSFANNGIDSFFIDPVVSPSLSYFAIVTPSVSPDGKILVTDAASAQDQTILSKALVCMRFKNDGEFISIADGNWNDPNIWKGHKVPLSNSRVIINSLVTVTEDAVCYSLKVDPLQSLTVNEGVRLTVLH